MEYDNYFDYDPYSPFVPQQEYVPQPPMKWFKFIIWFQLFANAVLNLIGGINTISGSQYGAYAELVYEVFDGLKTLDTFYGVALIAIAAFAIYTRFRLSGFRADGPQMYYILQVACIVLPLVYLVAASGIINSAGYGKEVSMDLASNVTRIAVSVVMLICNVSYFKKRIYLFKN